MVFGFRDSGYNYRNDHRHQLFELNLNFDTLLDAIVTCRHVTVDRHTSSCVQHEKKCICVKTTLIHDRSATALLMHYSIKTVCSLWRTTPLAACQNELRRRRSYSNLEAVIGVEGLALNLLLLLRLEQSSAARLNHRCSLYIGLRFRFRLGLRCGGVLRWEVGDGVGPVRRWDEIRIEAQVNQDAVARACTRAANGRTACVARVVYAVATWLKVKDWQTSGHSCELGCGQESTLSHTKRSQNAWLIGGLHPVTPLTAFSLLKITATIVCTLAAQTGSCGHQLKQRRCMRRGAMAGAAS
eukprot:3481940-Pleurochrysis_carterae.AAC.5